MAKSDSTTPRGFYERNGIWYVYRVFQGKRFRFSTKCAMLGDAINFIKDNHPELMRREATCPQIAAPTAHAEFRFTEAWHKDVLFRINYRNKLSGAAPVKMGDLKKIVSRSCGKCEATGIVFSATKIAKASRQPFMPSIDRISPHLPYSLGNCRLVCLAVNVAMNQWGDAVFDILAQGRVMTRLKCLSHNHSTT